MLVNISGYTINEILYEGAKTVVCRGCREEDGAPVIIKALKSAYPTRKELSRLRHEYDILQDLKVRGIVKPYRLERHENGLALISEDFRGESLRNFLKRNTTGLREFLIIASTLSEIVGEIHKNGIIHKDIKPGNIVINPETKETRIIDFGLSTRLQRDEQRDVNPGSLEGTLAYMSPEQTGRMNRSIDYRTDFYSLGVTFYEMLTGDAPFRSDDPMELVHCHIAKMPVSPHEMNKETPGVVSDIVMKLIRKNAEDRYQSAHGLKRDLDECLRQWEETGVVSGFGVGLHDMSEKFHIPQKLYGREPEVSMLMEGFERVCLGTPEVMLVCGYSGVGKSFLVNEVHKPIVAKRGYFISGKYDQYKRNIPYSGVIQAFRELIQQLLTESEACLAVWKETLLHALGHNGQVIIDVIPDVEHVTGKQPPVPQLGPQETQNRFNQVFQQFLGVFATEKHPLVIFLDDLQWVDLGSLKLLKMVMANPDCRYVYLVGAYRDNEVDSTHALTLAVDEFGKAGVVINKITLSPLGCDHICRILSDSLHCEREKVVLLSELLSQKTGGNPFFVNQFLTTLHAEGAIAFDFSRNCWQWDTECIEQKGYTDNIVELMAGKIQKFGENTQHALRLAACIGNTFDLRTLSAVHGKSEEETSGDLWDAVKDGLILEIGDWESGIGERGIGVGGGSASVSLAGKEDLGNGDQVPGVRDGRLEAGEQGIGGGKKETTSHQSTPLFPENMGQRLGDGGSGASETLALPSRAHDPQALAPKPYSPTPNPRFRFLHDRVQQAAYSLITDDLKKGVHLAIGRILLKSSSDVEMEENLFDIVNHLNTGIELITSQEERNELARLNLMAGRKAKASTAYEDALRHITTGMELLAAHSWQDQYELALSLHNEGASAAYLSGDFQKMDTLVALVLKHARTVLDRVNAYQTKIQAFMAQSKLTDALNTAVEIVNKLGVSIPKRPKTRHILAETFRTKWALRGKTIESLIDLPQMTDPHKLAALQLMSLAITPAYFTSPAFFAVLINKMVALSVIYGNASVSSVAYVFYAMLLCIKPDTIDAGYRFGRLALQLKEKFQARELTAILHGVFYNVVHSFKRHINEVFEPFQEGYLVGVETGSLEFACICASGYCGHPMFTSNDLVSSGREAAKYCERVNNLRQIKYINMLKIHLQIILNLQGESADPCRLAGDACNEDEMVSLFHAHNDHHSLADLYINKLLLSYTFGNYHQALEDIQALKKHYFAILGHYHVVVYNFYHSLTLLAPYPETLAHEQRRSLKTVISNQKILKKWARHAPMNNLHKYYLVEAELARVKGKDAQAADLYDKAIALANKNDFVNEEALSNEVAARFYLSKGKGKIARTYLQDARYCYYRWGAHAKVKDIEERYPLLFTETHRDKNPSDSTSPGTTSGDTTSKALDLSTVMKVSGTISGEIVLEKLLVKLMKLVIENAGAQKGFLILEKEGRLVIGAEGQAGSAEVKIPQGAPVEESGALPTSVINYTQRTRETVVVNDAVREGLFTGDRYIRETKPKSLLCVCMIYQGRMIGILYLENNLACGVFTPERVEFLKILSSQMAISVENAQLYGYLEQKVEARTQELARTLKEMEVLNDTLRQAKKVADEASRAKGEFVANISHEVRTPLNAVIGLADLALKTQDTAVQREYMEMIKASGETLLNLANDVLDISKIESGKWELENMDFGLRETVQNGIGALMFQARMKGLDFRVSIADDVPDRLYGDPQSLKQVLTNLIGNAVKFTERGEIVLTVSRGERVRRFTAENAEGAEKYEEEGNSAHCFGLSSAVSNGGGKSKANEHAPVTLRFSVRDTGIGIPEDKHGRIFERFTQADGSMTRRYGGTGLGVTISKKLVELMGGNIWFESKPGVGSAFHFRVAFGRRERERERGDYSVEEEIRPLNILLAEDNAFNRRVITDSLKMSGHLVTVAGNGKEAIEQWEKGSYDLILMDIQMPEMSGLEATEAIRRREAVRGGHTVIIAISAGAMKGDREKCLHAGMDEYISKPIDMKGLLGSLRKYFGVSGSVPSWRGLGGGLEATAGHGSSDDGIVNLFNLDSMPALKNNPEMLERYVRSFMKDMNDEMGNIERAIRDGDHEECRKAAHAVKGMSGHLKSGQIMRIAGEIERMGAENNLKAAGERFLELKKHCAEVCIILQTNQVTGKQC